MAEKGIEDVELVQVDLFKGDHCTSSRGAAECGRYI
jgi:hypothetical protein